MKLQTMDKNGKVTLIKEINQSELTSECWLIQMQGLYACESCDLLNTEECGGQEILKRINKKTKEEI